MKRIPIILFFILITNLSFAQKKFTVSQGGDGNFKTIQEALKAIPPNNKKQIIIYIKNGIYKEKLVLDSSKNHVKLIGEDAFKTILTFDDHTGKISPKGDTINTQTSYSFLILANDFTAENITFKNDAGFTAGQAVALEVRGDKAVFVNCRIIGNQDILFLNHPNSRQYYLNCYLEGTTDFIFGAATAWFQNCHIHSKKNSHITAASTPQSHDFGFVFNQCVLTGDTEFDKVSLGRPWRPFASVVYMKTYMGQHIKPEGWSVWNKLDTYKTARFAEYENFGPGAKVKERVNWAKQLTSAEAKKITLETVFKGWMPKLSK
jgi:pectinesterase